MSNTAMATITSSLASLGDAMNPLDQEIDDLSVHGQKQRMLESIPDPGWAGLAPCAGNFSGSWFRRVQISIQIDSSMRSTAMRDVGWSKVTCLPLAVINFTYIRHDHGCRVWTWVSL